MCDKDLLYELFGEYLNVSLDIKCMYNVLGDFEDKAEIEQNDELLYKVRLMKIVTDSIGEKLTSINNRLDKCLLNN